jgi:hypothetical protein
MLEMKKTNRPAHIRAIHGEDAIVRVIAEWRCPCGKRDVSPYDFRINPETGEMQVICDACHIDLASVELR